MPPWALLIVGSLQAVADAAQGFDFKAAADGF